MILYVYSGDKVTWGDAVVISIQYEYLLHQGGSLRSTSYLLAIQSQLCLFLITEYHDALVFSPFP